MAKRLKKKRRLPVRWMAEWPNGDLGYRACSSKAVLLAHMKEKDILGACKPVKVKLVKLVEVEE